MAGRLVLTKTTDSRSAAKLRYHVDARGDDRVVHLGSVHQVIKTGKWRMESDTGMSREQRMENFDTPEDAARELAEYRSDGINRWATIYANKKAALDGALAGDVVIEERGW